MIRLSPNDPWLQFYLAQRGTAEYFAGNYHAAIEWHEKSIQRNPNFPTTYRFIACAYARLGDLESAARALAELKRLDPDFSIAAYTRRARQVYLLESDFEQVVEALRLAGAPGE